MSAQVQPIREPETEAKPPEAPALGFSMQIATGEGRNVVLQTHVANDTPIADLKAMLTKMADAGDFVRARYDLDALERNIVADQRMLDQAREDEVRCGRDWEAQEAVEMEKLSSLDRDVDTMQKAEGADHVGRKWKPSPALRTMVGELGRGQLLAKERKVKHEADVGNFHVTVVKWEQEIARKQAEAGRLRALLG